MTDNRVYTAEHRRDYDIATLAEKATKVYADMYLGDGADDPPMTTRMARVEDAIASLAKLKWVVIGAIVALLVDIISPHLHFSF